jgi:hypothetical protein
MKANTLFTNRTNEWSFSTTKALKLLLACFTIAYMGNVFADEVKVYNPMLDTEGKKVVFEVYDGSKFIGADILQGLWYPITFPNELQNPILQFKVDNQVICRVKIDPEVRAANRGRPFYFVIKNDYDTGCNFIASSQKLGDTNLDDRIEYFPREMPQ